MAVPYQEVFHNGNGFFYAQAAPFTQRKKCERQIGGVLHPLWKTFEKEGENVAGKSRNTGEKGKKDSPRDLDVRRRLAKRKKGIQPTRPKVLCFLLNRNMLGHISQRTQHFSIIPIFFLLNKLKCVITKMSLTLPLS